MDGFPCALTRTLCKARPEAAQRKVFGFHPAELARSSPLEASPELLHRLRPVCRLLAAEESLYRYNSQTLALSSQ